MSIKRKIAKYKLGNDDTNSEKNSDLSIRKATKTTTTNTTTTTTTATTTTSTTTTTTTTTFSTLQHPEKRN